MINIYNSLIKIGNDIMELGRILSALKFAIYAALYYLTISGYICAIRNSLTEQC